MTPAPCRSLGALALLLWGCAGGGPAPAPGGPEVHAGSAAAAPALVAAAPPVAWLSEPSGTAVSLAVVVPGSAWEPPGATGVTLLAARAVLTDVGPELDRLGGRAAVACDRRAFVVTVTAPVARWRGAAELVVSALSAGNPSPAAVDGARSRLASTLRLDEANPAWQARLAAGRALYGDADGAWARPACGVPQTLDVFDAAAVREAAARLGAFAGAAIVGPADSADVAAVSSRIRALRTPEPALGVPPAAAAGRVYVERNTVTAWLAVSWPFGRDADPESVGVVGAVLEEALGPAATRPSVLHASSVVETHVAGGALVVTVVTAPGEAGRMALELEDAVDRIQAGLEPSSVLERVGRARWGDRLASFEAPADRAAAAAMDLVRGGAGQAWPRRQSFTAGAVRQAAEALGMPARAVVGPRAARSAAVP